MKKLYYVVLTSSMLLSTFALEQELKQFDSALKNLSGSLSGKKTPVVQKEDLIKRFRVLNQAIANTYNYIKEKGNEHVGLGILPASNLSYKEKEEARLYVLDLEMKLDSYLEEVTQPIKDTLVAEHINKLLSSINKNLSTWKNFIPKLILQSNSTQEKLYKNQYNFITEIIPNRVAKIQKEFETGTEEKSIEDVD